MKYMATIAQISNLRLNEIEWFADHIYQNADIHQEYYKLYYNAIELTKVSHLLLAVDSWKGEAFKGKRVDEINVGSMF